MRYPTDEELETVKKWKPAAGWNLETFAEFMEYVNSIADWYVFEREGNAYSLSTGGWSGNEDVIAALRGTYVNCDADHLFRYLDEQAFRFNNRKTTDGIRFLLVLNMVTGKRITYAQLIDNEKYKQLKLWGKAA